MKTVILPSLSKWSKVAHPSIRPCVFVGTGVSLDHDWEAINHTVSRRSEYLASK